MNPFARMLNDNVYIEDSNAHRDGPYKTSVGSQNGATSATIFEKDLNVEEGWKLIRQLPNGKEEDYTVLEVHYSSGLHAIPPNWQLKLKKDSSLIAPKKSPQATTININNSQGFQIGDGNVQHIASSIQGLIEKIDSANVSPAEKIEAKSLRQKVMTNPVVAAILGGAAGGLIELLKK